MSKQFYFSFILAALSFITVKRIQKAGIEHYNFLQILFEKENGWFNFNNPGFILNLPFELRNISGLTDYSSNEIACLQDESGTIFIYNLDADSIVGQYNFGSIGDFEGLTKVDSSYYILRKDATLIEINYPWDSTNIVKTKLNLSSIENEGLCYDERNNRLLFVPKNKIGKDNPQKDIRNVLAIDLASKEMDDDPLFQINISEIEAFAKEKNIPLPQKQSKQSSDSISALKFIPTSIAVHPKTDEIYIVSSIDQTLAVFDKNGTLLNFMLLDPLLFNNPESIAFLKNGDLIITNRSMMGKPTLRKFEWQSNSIR